MTARVIYKYPISVGVTKIPVAGGAPLCVQVQKDQPCVWVELDADGEPNADLWLTVVVTGMRVLDRESEAEYLGTFQLHDGEFVGHVYFRLAPLSEAS